MPSKQRSDITMKMMLDTLCVVYGFEYSICCGGARTRSTSRKEQNVIESSQTSSNVHETSTSNKPQKCIYVYMRVMMITVSVSANIS